MTPPWATPAITSLCLERTPGSLTCCVKDHRDRIFSISAVSLLCRHPEGVTKLLRTSAWVADKQEWSWVDHPNSGNSWSVLFAASWGHARHVISNIYIRTRLQCVWFLVYTYYLSFRVSMATMLRQPQTRSFPPPLAPWQFTLEYFSVVAAPRHNHTF